MSFLSQNDFSTSSRIDFSGIFESSPKDVKSGTRRRHRQISTLQFEPEFEDLDSKEEMSMEALHFFGLSDDHPSPPVTPKMFENLSEDSLNLKKRHRHFSLEDYNAMDESEDSNSNISGANNSLISSKRVRQGSIFFPSMADDSAVAHTPSSYGSSKIDDLFSTKFFSDIPSMSLELDNDHISSQLKSELESRLMETLCPAPGSSNPKPRGRVALELPPQLLSIIASHIIQEATNEPYGLKGCLLHIYYESETDCEYWSTLDCDPETLPTFELTLTLRQDASKRRGWRNKLPELVRSFSSLGFGSVLIGTSYKLVKRRHYMAHGQEEESLLKL